MKQKDPVQRLQRELKTVEMLQQLEENPAFIELTIEKCQLLNGLKERLLADIPLSEGDRNILLERRRHLKEWAFFFGNLNNKQARIKKTLKEKYGIN
jgi:hypothetical protein